MGPYGSDGAHIKTGWRHMAHDHFQTPPDPTKCYTNLKNTPNSFLKYFPSMVAVRRSGARPDIDEAQWSKFSMFETRNVCT